MTTLQETVHTSSTGREARPNRAFYFSMAALILLAVLVAFGRRYFLQALTNASAFPVMVHSHAIVFTGWVILLVVQTRLVAADNIALHRRLGIAGAALAALMVPLGIIVALYGARRGHNPGGPFSDAAGFLIVPLTDILLFAGFVGAGFLYRKRRDVHKRCMLLATIGGLLWPTVTRLPYVAGRFLPMFALLVIFVLAGPVHDLLTRRRVHPVYLWGALIIAAIPIRALIGSSEAWHRIAEWLIR